MKRKFLDIIVEIGTSHLTFYARFYQICICKVITYYLIHDGEDEETWMQLYTCEKDMLLELIKNIRPLVALIKDALYCYGTLISPNFVVTAGNCIAATSVQYGDLSIPWYLTTSMEKILFAKRPRSNKFLEPDLGMVFIKEVQIKFYGKLSAVDYKAMTGHIINYTNFLVPQEEILKEGLVISCNLGKESVSAAHICVAPKGVEKQQLSVSGEPGSPLFFDGKLAGVHVGGSTLQFYGDTKPYFLRTYVPISPFLSWFYEVQHER